MKISFAVNLSDGLVGVGAVHGNCHPLMPYTGGLIASDRHTGHLPGAVNLVRFLNTNPQSRHSAGLDMTLKPFPKDRST